MKILGTNLQITQHTTYLVKVVKSLQITVHND